MPRQANPRPWLPRSKRALTRVHATIPPAGRRETADAPAKTQLFKDTTLVDFIAKSSSIILRVLFLSRRCDDDSVVKSSVVFAFRVSYSIFVDLLFLFVNVVKFTNFKLFSK